MPVSIRAGLRLTPEQFAVLCGAIPDAVLELAADGSLIYMTPTGGDMGARHTNSVRRKATKFITNPTCLDMPCRITVQGLKGPSFQGTEERTNKSLPGSGEEGSIGSMVGSMVPDIGTSQRVASDCNSGIAAASALKRQ